MTTCTHPNLIALGTNRCDGFQHCPTCGWESAAPGHIWVPAGLEHEDPRICARCNTEQKSTSAG